MLVLTRKFGESIVIGGAVVTIQRRQGNTGVKVSVDAPREVKVLRGELRHAEILAFPKLIVAQDAVPTREAYDLSGRQGDDVARIDRENWKSF